MIDETCVCLVDGSFGIHVPQRFAQLHGTEWGLEPEDLEVLLFGHDHALYWDVWDRVLDYAVNIDGMILEQDGDLFAVA